MHNQDNSTQIERMSPPPPPERDFQVASKYIHQHLEHPSDFHLRLDPYEVGRKRQGH